MKKEGHTVPEISKFNARFESDVPQHSESRVGPDVEAESRFEITSPEDSAYAASAPEYSFFENEQRLARRISGARQLGKIGTISVIFCGALFGVLSVLKTESSFLNTNLRALNLQAHLLLKDFPEVHARYTELTGDPIAAAIQKPRLTPEKVAFVAQMAGFPKEAAETMTCIAFAESSHRHSAKNRNRNGTHDTGLFQINDVWLKPCKVTRADLLDPMTNAKCAYQVWKVSGFSAWEGYKRQRKKCDAFSVAGQAVANK